MTWSPKRPVSSVTDGGAGPVPRRLIWPVPPPRRLLCQELSERHHIPGWQSSLDEAELQELARAARGEELGVGGQGLSAHLLPEPPRKRSFITCADVKSRSCGGRFESQVDVSEALSLLCVEVVRPRRSYFRKARHLEAARFFFPLFYLICVISLQA